MSQQPNWKRIFRKYGQRLCANLWASTKNGFHEKLLALQEDMYITSVRACVEAYQDYLTEEFPEAGMAIKLAIAEYDYMYRKD